MTQQAVRIREIGAESDIPGLIIEVGLDRTDLANLGKLVSVCQHQFNFQFIPMCINFIFEITDFGHVKVNPHHAIVGQCCQHITFRDQAAMLMILVIDDAIKGCLDSGKSQFGFDQI